MRPAFAALLLAAAAFAGAAPARADSYWDHNGSLMRLSASGNSRVFTYEKPRSGMRAQGVRAGTVLFQGVRDGDAYHGTAYVFSADCGEPLGYEVSGDVVSERHVVLFGTREVYADGCRPTGRQKTDRLEFRLKYTD